MISPTSSAVLTIGVSAGNNILDPKKSALNARFIIGALLYLVFLAVLNDTNPKFAGQFAFAVLIGALLLNGVSVAQKLGYAK